jgi:hypothetical protein
MLNKAKFVRREVLNHLQGNRYSKRQGNSSIVYTPLSLPLCFEALCSLSQLAAALGVHLVCCRRC